MVKIRNGNPVIASALICAALFYSNLVRPKKAHPYKSLVPKSEIAIATGTICSNPVKSSSGGTYRADFFLESVTSKTGETSESRGILPILIPAELVEAFFPGKLYTRTGGARGIVAENGARLKIGGQTFQSQKSGQDCFSVSWANPLGWESSLSKVRGQLRLQFKRLMHSWGNAGGLLLALLSGSREYTEKQVSEAFTGAGLSHILALSGMHLSLFGGIALFLGKKLAGKKIAAVIQLFAIVFFVLFAGLSPSLFRAFLCSLILCCHSLLGMNMPSSLSVLAASFLIHAIIFPAHLTDTAFLLSYSSLAGIMLFSATVKKWLSPRIIPSVRSSLAESTAAQFSTAPISAHIFGRLMPVGICASVVLSPLVTIFLYAGLLGICLCLLLPFLSNTFNGIMNGLYDFIKWIVCFFAQFPSIKVGLR